MSWDENLDKKSDEYKFVASEAKWVKVLAGPGTGKSFCLKRRILRLLEQRKADPSKILVLTFTKVAADDLKSSVKELAKSEGIEASEVDKIKVSTLHSLCRDLMQGANLLDKNNYRTRMLQDFEIKTMLLDLEPDCGKIGRKKELLRFYENDLDGKGSEIKDKALLQQYKVFCKSLSAWTETYGGLVPGELVTRLCRYLNKNRSARKKLSYQYVMVDEYQDLNKSEQRLVELLTYPNDGRLAVIGDDDQSIYEFKGGSLKGIQDFDKVHKRCKTFYFDKCRRCPEFVVDMANKLIVNNSDREKKRFETIPGFLTGIYEEHSWKTPGEEIDGLCKLIENETKTGLDPGDIVVLTPTRARGKRMQEALLNAGVKTAICFRDSVFDSEDARVAFSKLSILAQPDDLISWRYMLGKGKVKSFNTIQQKATDGHTILDVLNDCAKQKTNPGIGALVKQFRNLMAEMEELRGRIQNDRSELLRQLCPSGGAFCDVLQKAIERANASNAPVGVDKWLSDVRNYVIQEIYFPEAEFYTNKVRVLSLHAAKGLSAPMVVIMSAIDDLIPIGSTAKKLEEQRRLFYVAITRCKGANKPTKKVICPGKLVISYFTNSEDGQYQYQRTRFLEEALQ